ncbi:MAG: GNAT family N-acetyltransferase, partial [Stellaceae bacterium]
MSAVIRPLTRADLPAARRICRTAFGTFLGAPDPENFWADRDYVHGRFGAEHVTSFAAELDGELVGSNFATCWGSVGFFGPITMLPERQGRGIGKALVEAVSDQFEDWGVGHAGLCTFPQSPLHIALYGKFGFRARFLTPIMAAPARPAGDAGSWSRYGDLAEGDRRAVEPACREVTDMLYDGLDLGAEIRTGAARELGDTLLLWDGASRLAGFAVCHWGPASEAGKDC